MSHATEMREVEQSAEVRWRQTPVTHSNVKQKFQKPDPIAAEQPANTSASPEIEIENGNSLTAYSVKPY